MRNCGTKYIQHTPKVQIYNVVDVVGTGVHVICRKLNHFRVENYLKEEIKKFSSENGLVSKYNSGSNIDSVNGAVEDELLGDVNPSETGVVGVTVGGGGLMEEDSGGGGTIGSSEPVKEVSMLEKYGILRKDETKLLRELVNKYNKKGILSTTCKSGNYSSIIFCKF